MDFCAVLEYCMGLHAYVCLAGVAQTPDAAMRHYPVPWERQFQESRPQGVTCSGMEAIDLLFNYLRLAFQRTIPWFWEPISIVHLINAY